MNTSNVTGKEQASGSTAGNRSHATGALHSKVQVSIAALAVVGILTHLVLRYSLHMTSAMTQEVKVGQDETPLVVILVGGGLPLVWALCVRLWRREFGSDLLAGISIVTSVFLHQYLAGSLVVLMLSGGEALEEYATRSASSVLHALARRMPSIALRVDHNHTVEVPLGEVKVGDKIVVPPHALCPVDGTVLEGHGTMDESYLTGEPYTVSKAPGTAVLSGAVNGESLLTVLCDRPASDSRYARIMKVMQDSEQQRPQMRRLADQLGAWYTPIAVGIAVCAWAISGSSMRFLSVLVIATPCPLLIAIPIAIIGSISLAARHGIIIKDPSVLETIGKCRVAIFDKTGTLTYGRPVLTEVTLAADTSCTKETLLALVASAERYSKHPLALAILEAAHQAHLALHDAVEVKEEPGIGLIANVQQHELRIGGRTLIDQHYADQSDKLAAAAEGMECVVVVDGIVTACFRFRDEPRQDGVHFIGHLSPRHAIQRILLLSGDRESEVRYLAERVGITEVLSGQSPEQKLETVRRETSKACSLFLGDGINDAPALTAASVGIAFGNNSDITGEAAGAVIMDSSLERVDILFHIGSRMRTIALQSALGGMALSLAGMAFAAGGRLTPVTGAVLQEVIDVVAVVNALRAALPPKTLSDY